MATPIVNITPRTLPNTGDPDRLGLVVQATDLLGRHQEQERARRDRAAELQADREWRGTQAAADRAHELIGITLRGLEARRGQRLGGEIESGHIQERGDVQGELIDRRGDVQGELEQGRWDREAPQREIDNELRGRQVGAQERGAEARYRDSTVRLNRSIFDMNRQLGFGVQPRASGGSYPLMGLARDVLGSQLELGGVEDMTPERLRAGVALAAGDTTAIPSLLGPAGEASRSPSPAPPAEARERAGAAEAAQGGDVLPGPDSMYLDMEAEPWRQNAAPPAFQGLTDEQVAELQGLDLNSHLTMLQMIPQDSPDWEAYLNLLPDSMQAQVLEALESPGMRR